MAKRWAVMFGGNSTIAKAMAPHLANDYRLLGVGRSASAPEEVLFSRWHQTDYSDGSLSELADSLDQQPVGLLLCCVGTLHTPLFTPEKKLADLNSDQLRHYFEVNSVIPALLLKYFVPLLPRGEPAKAVFLSAKVAGISDNRLGGWYGYRASKAALNMLLKTTSIELARTHRQACLVALHPGTTESELSRPFTAKLPPDKLFTPAQTALRLCGVIEQLTAADNGRFVHWDGSDLPW